MEHEAPAVERVRLRRVSRVLGFAEVRLYAVHLRGLEVREGPDGRLTVKPPEIEGRSGRWPAYAIQPGWREAIEHEISCLWARS